MRHPTLHPSSKQVDTLENCFWLLTRILVSTVTNNCRTNPKWGTYSMSHGFYPSMENVRLSLADQGPVCLTSPHPPSGAPPRPRPAPALRLWKLMSAATTISRWSNVRHCSLHPLPTHLLQLQRFRFNFNVSVLLIFVSKCFWSDFIWIWICLHILVDIFACWVRRPSSGLVPSLLSPDLKCCKVGGHLGGNCCWRGQFTKVMTKKFAQTTRHETVLTPCPLQVFPSVRMIQEMS